jgi:uracil-DNA glycosylase
MDRVRGRCAPPGDKPKPEEIRNCRVHLEHELAALPRVRVIVCLGKIAFDGYLAHLLHQGVIQSRAPFRFGHGVEYAMPHGTHLLASYHPSLRNTNTGRLDRAMFARVFVRAREIAGLDVSEGAIPLRARKGQPAPIPRNRKGIAPSLSLRKDLA